jgi:hypothetical protein
MTSCAHNDTNQSIVKKMIVRAPPGSTTPRLIRGTRCARPQDRVAATPGTRTLRSALASTARRVRPQPHRASIGYRTPAGRDRDVQLLRAARCLTSPTTPMTSATCLVAANRIWPPIGFPDGNSLSANDSLITSRSAAEALSLRSNTLRRADVGQGQVRAVGCLDRASDPTRSRQASNVP